jgi:lipopolysaccharide export LptBFGC system permease protein LptF
LFKTIYNQNMKNALFFFGFWLCLSGLALANQAVDPCSIAGATSRCQPTEMNFWQIYDLIQIREALGLPVAELWTQLHLKFSLPLAPFFITLLVAPLGLLIAKRGASVSVALSIGLVFVWYLLYSTFAPLGQTGVVAPFLAAWIQNLIFGCLGLGILLWFNRDRLSFWQT